MKSNAPQSKPLRTVLAVTGMMCGHCEKSVREALEAVPGVAAALSDRPSPPQAPTTPTTVLSQPKRATMSPSRYEVEAVAVRR